MSDDKRDEKLENETAEEKVESQKEDVESKPETSDSKADGKDKDDKDKKADKPMSDAERLRRKHLVISYGAVIGVYVTIVAILFFKAFILS